MSDENDPLVHIVGPGGDKWNVCLNRLGKQIAAAAVALALSLLSGAFIFAWQSNAQLAKIDDLPAQMKKLDNKLDQVAVELRARGIRNSERISKIEGRLDMGDEE